MGFAGLISLSQCHSPNRGPMCISMRVPCTWVLSGRRGDNGEGGGPTPGGGAVYF